MEKRKDENSGGLHKICVCVPGTAGISDSREKIWNQERILESFMAGLLPLLVFGVAGVFNMISAISGGPAVE